MSDYRVEALEAEIERLQDRIQFLEDTLGLDRPLLERLPLEWGLTGKEARLFGILMARDIASKATLMGGLYDPGIDDEPQIKIVDVFVCKIRAKVKEYGVEIETKWGEGYALSPKTKAIVREQMSQPAEAA